MTKFLSALILVATFSFTTWSQPLPPQNLNDPPSQGVAPTVPNGLGRADVRVFDESGNPIKDAFVKLESTRTDGFFCESWGPTDDHGIIALPQIHMGHLKLKVKAKHYQSQELKVMATDLGNPIRVTLKRH
jgi:hypothetical protein